MVVAVSVCATPDDAVYMIGISRAKVCLVRRNGAPDGLRIVGLKVKSRSTPAALSFHEWDLAVKEPVVFISAVWPMGYPST